MTRQFRQLSGPMHVGLHPDARPVGVTPGEIEARDALAAGLKEYGRRLAETGVRFEDEPGQDAVLSLWDYQQPWYRRPAREARALP